MLCPFMREPFRNAYVGIRRDDLFSTEFYCLLFYARERKRGNEAAKPFSL